MISQDDVKAVYEQIIAAAVAIMRCEVASMQMLYPERSKSGELNLLASHGPTPEATTFWEWVRADSNCSCGEALRTGKRAMIASVERCEFMAGTEDRAAYLKAGIRAAQPSPLISRSGDLIGMISTHWHKPHEPSERDFRMFDILARRAADLVERTKAEQALRKSEDRLQRMVNVDGVGVLVFAVPERRLVDANDHFIRMSGYSRAEIESSAITWRTMTPPEYVAISEAQLVGFAATGRIGPYEKEYLRTDGSRAWIVFAGAALGDGTVAEYCIDVSDRKRAEEALREADRRKDEFLATLAHELRNPLAPIRNGLEIMRLSRDDANELER